MHREIIKDLRKKTNNNHNQDDLRLDTNDMAMAHFQTVCFVPLQASTL